MRKRQRRRVVGYELLERLGQGGFAEVWRARQSTRGFSREICIKRARGFDGGVRRALAEEARLLAMISHGNVVRLLDVLEDAHGHLELCLEFVDGCDVARLRRTAGGELPPAELLVAIGAAIGGALHALSQVDGGVVHRDVSPHNVMLASSGQVKLIDLGIARAAARDAWTASGVVKGKPMYLSPEQAQGARLTPSSDVFALGVLLYELACGINPWGSEPWAHPSRLRWQPPPALEVLRPELPAATCRAIHGLLAERPSDRPSADEAAGALQGSLSNPAVDLSGYVAHAVARAEPELLRSETTDRTLEITAYDYPAS